MSENIEIEKNLVKDLYDSGIVKVNNLLDKNVLNEIIIAKDKIFSNFPYGQNNVFEKLDNKETQTGDYPIKNLLDLDPIFKEILKNRSIQSLVEKVLGKNYYLTNMSMRKIPKTNHILHTHRDYCGGLSFSLLLDKISLDQGETFFYQNSHKNPPPNIANIKKNEKIISTTGDIGDMYFWFPDSWHGRNLNLTNNQTCILMGDFENENTNRKSIYIYNNFQVSKKNFLNKIFSNIGNKPNNLITHFFYCLIRFKIFKDKINKEKTIYTRLSSNEEIEDAISLKEYFSHISIKKLLKVAILSFLKMIIGKNLYQKLKKIIKK